MIGGGRTVFAWSALALALAACGGETVRPERSAAALATVAPAASAAPAFATVDRTATSHIVAARTAVVRDAAAWQGLWTEHAGVEAPLPPVDFAKDMVIGVFLGHRASGCYAADVAALEETGGKLRVQAVETTPGPNSVCMMMITAPAHLIVTARSDLAVEFATETRAQQ